MERPLVSQIYAYIVCLIAIVIGLASLAGFVGSTFRAAHPTTSNVLYQQRVRVHPGGMRDIRGFQGGPVGIPPMKGPIAIPPMNAPDVVQSGAMVRIPEQLTADARYNAITRMFVTLVLLVAAAILFTRHWRWLHGPTAGSIP